MRDDVRHNRERWNAYAHEYQRVNAPQITEQTQTGDIAWGVWGIPESRLGVLGDVAGLDVLEAGCGGAQWSVALALRGARPVGLDLSDAQLEHASRLVAERGVAVRLVQGDVEALPFDDGAFDIVFADHGGFSFADPYRAVPEAARVLRSGGLLAFCRSHPIMTVAEPLDAEHAEERLVNPYFEMHRIDWPGWMVEYQLPFGEWIRLFRRSGLLIEDLIEPRPDPGAVSTYRDDVDREWSRRWPAETIWRLRKP